MIAEIILVIVATLFGVLSVFLFNGKGSWLIAGYNTASPEEKAKYDVKKLCKRAGVICAVSSGMLYVTAYLGYQVDTGKMNEDIMLPFGLIAAAIILTTVFLSIHKMNTGAKK